jgi:hypothetical protein
MLYATPSPEAYRPPTRVYLSMRTRIGYLRLLAAAAFSFIRPRMVPGWRADRLSGRITEIHGRDASAHLLFQMPAGVKVLKNIELLPAVATFVRGPRAPGQTLFYLALPCGCRHVLYGCVDSAGKVVGGLETLDAMLQHSIRRRRRFRAIGFGILTAVAFLAGPAFGGITAAVSLWYIFPPGTARARMRVLDSARLSIVY